MGHVYQLSHHLPSYYLPASLGQVLSLLLLHPSTKGLPIFCDCYHFLTPMMGFWVWVQGGSGLGTVTLWYLWAGHNSGCPSPGLTELWHIQWSTCQPSLLSTPVQLPKASRHRSNNLLRDHLSAVGRDCRLTGRVDAWLELRGVSPWLAGGITWQLCAQSRDEDQGVCEGLLSPCLYACTQEKNDIKKKMTLSRKWGSPWQVKRETLKKGEKRVFLEPGPVII